MNQCYLCSFEQCSNHITVEIHGQSKGQKVNPINIAPISNLMTDLESLYNFLSEYMFEIVL